MICLNARSVGYPPASPMPASPLEDRVGFPRSGPVLEESLTGYSKLNRGRTLTYLANYVMGIAQVMFGSRAIELRLLFIVYKPFRCLKVYVAEITKYIYI